MDKTAKTAQQKTATEHRSNCRFAFNANRSQASRRARYIETSINASQCTLCELNKR